MLFNGLVRRWFSYKLSISDLTVKSNITLIKLLLFYCKLVLLHKHHFICYFTVLLSDIFSCKALSFFLLNLTFLYLFKLLNVNLWNLEMLFLPWILPPPHPLPHLLFNARSWTARWCGVSFLCWCHSAVWTLMNFSVKEKKPAALWRMKEVEMWFCEAWRMFRSADHHGVSWSQVQAHPHHHHHVSPSHKSCNAHVYQAVHELRRLLFVIKPPNNKCDSDQHHLSD